MLTVWSEVPCILMEPLFGKFMVTVVHRGYTEQDTYADCFATFAALSLYFLKNKIKKGYIKCENKHESDQSSNIYRFAQPFNKEISDSAFTTTLLEIKCQCYPMFAYRLYPCKC